MGLIPPGSARSWRRLVTVIAAVSPRQTSIGFCPRQGYRARASPRTPATTASPHVCPGAVIDWTRIFSPASEAGIEHYFVEHDVARAPFESLAASYAYLRDLRF